MADRGEHNAQEPALATSGAGLIQQKVVLFALVRAFDAAMVVVVLGPKVRIARDRGEETIVGLGIGINDASIG